MVETCIKNNKKYYFDTSIWLDFFENRDESSLPKSEFVHKLINKIVEENGKIVYSDAIILELINVGYTEFEIEGIFSKIKQILVFVESERRQFGKAKDLALKRNVPKRDALHFILARDNNVVLVTRDRHFQKLLDIARPNRPEELL